jgi:hypothetical protein
MSATRLFLALAVAGNLACGGGGDSGPSGVFPDLTGSWGGSQLPWVTGLTWPGFASNGAGACAGSMTVVTQAGDAFSGTFVQGSGCDVSGRIVEGHVQAQGALSFRLVPEAGDPFPDWARAQVEGCTPVADSGTYEGSLIGDWLKAERTLSYDCPSNGRTIVQLAFSGVRG